jgi:hypothetical protein
MNAVANALSLSPANRTVTAPPAPPEAGMTRSPACSTASISEPGAPGTTPPVWKCGSFGTLMVLPPMPGTQPGTVHDSRPIVLFHASATRLNAARYGAEMNPATLENTRRSCPGNASSQSQTSIAVFLIRPRRPSTRSRTRSSSPR